MSRYAHRLALAPGGGDADDIVQEALVRAWRRWETFDPARGMPVAWLLAIVADQARRARTRGDRRLGTRAFDRGSALDHREFATAAADPAADPDLERALARLSPRQRQAIDLFYFVGLDVAAAAQVMGCAPGTVQATLHQARARLRELLGDPDD